MQKNAISLIKCHSSLAATCRCYFFSVASLHHHHHGHAEQPISTLQTLAGRDRQIRAAKLLRKNLCLLDKKDLKIKSPNFSLFTFFYF